MKRLLALATSAALLAPIMAAAQPQQNCGAAPTAVPVTGTTDPVEQRKMLEDEDPQLAANKKLVYDMWRTLLNAYQIDRAGEFIHQDYIQHNPMANTGLAGMQAFFRMMNRPPGEVPEAIPEGVVDILAEGDKVVIVFPRSGTDSCGRQFTTTWFDMFRIANGKIVEHWDPATRN
jgi:predicted SnoaL-like aldol condensation-catalyzing enzyme